MKTVTIDRPAIRVLCSDGIEVNKSACEPFSYVYKGHQYRSFHDIFEEHAGKPDFYDPCQNASDPVHSRQWKFAHSSAVESFLKTFNCYWLADLVNSYFLQFSPVYYDENGALQDNPLKHSRKIVFIKYFINIDGQSVVVFEDEDHHGVYTFIQQRMKSDLSVDVSLWLADGYLFFPSEY